MSKSREYALVLLFFIVLTAAFTWPLAIHPGSGVMSDYGDPLLNTWILAHDAHAVTSMSDFFQGNIIYPSRDIITYSEHQYSTALVVAPVYWITGNPLVAYNFLFFFGFVFSAFGMYLLLRYLTGNCWAGLAAGLFFAFAPYKFSQIGHAQICFSAFFPFILLYLHKFLKEERTRHLVIFGVFLLAQVLASWHYAIYAAMAVLLVIAGQTFLDWRHTGWAKLVKLAAVGVVCAMLVLPFALPYARTHARFDDFQRPLEETLLYNARLGDYLTVIPQSVLYGNGNRFIHLPNAGVERILFPGLSILFLAAMGLMLRRRDYEGLAEEEVEKEGPPEEKVEEERDGWPVLAPYLALMLASFLLTFGPVIAGHENYFYTIPYDLGLLTFSRVPARFFIPLSVGLAVFGGIGLDRLTRRVKNSPIWRLDTRQLVAVAFCAFLLLEVAVYKLPFPRVVAGDAIPQAYRWMAEQGDVRMVSLPTDELIGVHVYDRDVAVGFENASTYIGREGYLIYLSTVHWKDTMNGYSGYFPFSYRRSMTEFQGFPSERSVDLLEALNINYVVWHWEWVPEENMEYCEKQFAALGGRLELVGRFADQEIFRVVRAGQGAEAADLETALAVPDALPAGQRWNLGLTVTAPPAQPFVSTDEEFHTLRLSWSGEGDAGFEQEVKFHTPFFVDSAETWTVALDVPGTPPPGEWELTARVEGGALDGREFTTRISVKEEIPISSHPVASMDARLDDVKNLEGLALAQQDGLFATWITVTNTGETQWLADSEDPKLVGVVRLAMRFQQGDKIVWDEQRFTLPCDVSPGQTVTMPVLLRVPDEAGGYRLYISMTDEGYGWFGQELETDMDVGEVKVGTETNR